ncbi:hypothetical protein DM01DRAFT_129195 [Hesseltinella vesiculosa]|uniref:Attractin/MKLN-like beta-propeller domain-containing protein n=1 Tax=Hesseltinella vesiculosa TaxID=101127 RepID=A0A1X2GS32_9FUNG|nr:hypothetical protein DM01DRAFT_129195 [Hesseltinella vesiculosa]
MTSTTNETACALTYPDTIYCYGGSTTRKGTDGDDVFSDTAQIAMLDLTSFDFTNIPSLPWSTSNFAYVNGENLVLSINNGSELLLYSGYDTTDNVGYVVLPSNTGFQISKSFQLPAPNTNSTYFLYEGAAVYVPSISQVLVFGGLQAGGVPFVGYKLAGTSVISYSILNNQLSAINATTPGGLTRYGHTASLSSNGTTMYIIGGFTWAPNSVSGLVLTNATLQDIWAFDTTTSLWNEVQANTNSSILGRMYHSTTSIPGTTLQFICGGVTTLVNDVSNPQMYFNDLAYLYDDSTNSMYPAPIGNPAGGPNHLFTPIF